MANTNSWAFPNLFDVTTNRINIVEDEASVTNRTRLLILTEPTELYMNPNFGVGLKRYLWQYNTDNVKAMIKDRIKDQLAINEPCVEAQETEFSDDLLEEELNRFSSQEYNRLKMTIGLKTTFGGTAQVALDDEIPVWSDETTYTDTDSIALRDK